MKLFPAITRTPFTKAVLGGLALCCIGTSSAAATFRPECFAPASATTKVIKYDARPGPYRMAFVNGFAGNDWRVQSIQAAKAWAARPENAKHIKEFKVVSVGNDSAAQIAAIDNFIAAGYDGITFIAVNPTAFGAVIKRAERAKTVLVPFDNVLDTDKIVQINENQFELGALKARSVVDLMGKPQGKVLEVRGLPGNATDRDNHLGMRSVLDKLPGLSVVEVVGNWDAGTVQKVTADAIATHGRFDAVLVQEGTIGAINAMANANHPIVPVGGDAGNGFRMAMVEKKIGGVSAAQAPAMSATALSAIVALLQGNALPQMVALPIPYKHGKDVKAGVDFFPDLPKTFNTATGFPQCDKPFTPQELAGQSPTNN